MMRPYLLGIAVMVGIGCGYAEEQQGQREECCECLATTIDYSDVYCWRGDTYADRKAQCEQALEHDQAPYVERSCKEQKCGGSCPMLN